MADVPSYRADNEQVKPIFSVPYSSSPHRARWSNRSERT